MRDIIDLPINSKIILQLSLKLFILIIRLQFLKPPQISYSQFLHLCPIQQPAML